MIIPIFIFLFSDRFPILSLVLGLMWVTFIGILVTFKAKQDKKNQKETHLKSIMLTTTNTAQTKFYEFDVPETETDEIDFYVPDTIEVIDYNPDKEYKEDAKRMRYEMKLSHANNDIEHLAPKLKEVQKKIKEIEKARYWRTADGHYKDTDTKVEKELERLRDKEYSISKALSKAEYNKADAEMYFERYGE